MPTHSDSYLSLQAFIAVFMNLQKLYSIFSFVFPASLLKLLLRWTLYVFKTDSS